VHDLGARKNYTCQPATEARQPSTSSLNRRFAEQADCIGRLAAHQQGRPSQSTSRVLAWSKTAGVQRIEQVKRR
jgi:hypothetical protein